MKKLIATRSIVADRRYLEGEVLELEDIHADPLIACGAAVLAADAALINEGDMPQVIESKKPTKAKKGSAE